MNEFKFSIIIAVYNVEKYIKETIDSVINQTMDFEKNIEIILVDDGSVDNSAVICKEYEKTDPDHRVSSRDIKKMLELQLLETQV